MRGILDFLGSNKTFAGFSFFLAGFGVIMFFSIMVDYLGETWSEVVAGVTIVPAILVAVARVFRKK